MPNSSSEDSTSSRTSSVSSHTTVDSNNPIDTHFQFVVAGGSYAAINAVKIICKHIIPQAIAKTPSFRAKITVIAPNRESYWNVAAVRLIAEPELMDLHGDQIFFPLEPSMRQHLPKTPKNTMPHILQVIQGKVLSIDSQASMLTYLKLDDEGTSQQENDFFCHTVSYNKLVLATGASSSSPAFKLNGSSELTKAALRDIQESTKKASSICIVGAGGVGVELAGELGYKYGHTKKVRLYSAFDGTLERLKQSIADDAITKLKNLGVETITNSRAISAHRERENACLGELAAEMASMSTSTTATTNSNGSIPPMPALSDEYLDEYYAVDVDDEHLASRQERMAARLSSPRKSGVSARQSHDSVSTNSSLFRKHSQPPHHHHHHHTHLNLVRSPTTISTSTNQSDDHNNLHPSVTGKRRTQRRTVVTFENGYKESFDSYIPTTGNIPNSSYLPHMCLDANGYVLTDPYLRMAHHNPYNDIYVYGDLVSGGSQTIADLSDAQKVALKASLLHDVLSVSHNFNTNEHGQQQHEKSEYPLKAYKPSGITYYVPISKNGGVGQTGHGFPIPGFVVSLMKGKHFRMKESKKFLLK